MQMAELFPMLPNDQCQEVVFFVFVFFAGAGGNKKRFFGLKSTFVNQSRGDNFARFKGLRDVLNRP